MGRPPKLPPISAGGSAKQSGALREAGRCVTAPDPEVFFDEARADEALALCDSCPLLAACLDHAIRHEANGVWGGTTPVQRDALRGARLLATPEDARWADSIRARIARGDQRQVIAEAEHVTLRTLERWIAQDAAGGLGKAA